MGIEAVVLKKVQEQSLCEIAHVWALEQLQQEGNQGWIIHRPEGCNRDGEPFFVLALELPEEQRDGFCTSIQEWPETSLQRFGGKIYPPQLFQYLSEV